MQQAKLMVLGYLAAGPLYGYEMERKIEENKIRLWAKIGFSTIYKALKDLERDGHVAAKTEEAERGIARRRYTITKTGRRLLSEQIAASLASPSPAYCDRIPGMIFAMRQGGAKASAQIDTAIGNLTEVQNGLKPALRKAEKGAGKIALQYYADVLAAESKALRAAKATMK